MKHILYFLLTLLLTTSVLKTEAQLRNNPLKDFFGRVIFDLEKTPWIAGLGGNVIEDDGKPFKVFDAKKGWNIAPYPTRVSIEKTMLYGWSSEFAFTYNYIKTGKIINGDVRTTTGNYLCFDLSGKFNFNQFFKEKTWFDVYALHGYGFTHRDANRFQNAMTFNVGVGADAWVYQNIIGINIQTQAKFGISLPILKSGANYLQHSLGIVYRFNNGTGGYKPGVKHGTLQKL